MTIPFLGDIFINMVLDIVLWWSQNNFNASVVYYHLCCKTIQLKQLVTSQGQVYLNNNIFSLNIFDGNSLLGVSDKKLWNS